MLGWKKGLLRYSLLFSTGYCVYLALEVTFRGYSFRLMGLTGGIVMVVIGFLLRHGMWKLQLPVQMLIGAVIITALELATGLFSLEVLGIRMWDYRDEWMSMCANLICPRYTLYWFLLSGVAIFFIGALDYYLLDIGSRPVYRMFRWKFAFPEARGIRQGQTADAETTVRREGRY